MFAQLAIKVRQPAIMPSERNAGGARYRHRISRNLQIGQQLVRYPDVVCIPHIIL
jgi:hypothetical protein